jgi:hypothetical protein
MPMTAHVLLTATLFRAPEQRTSKSGKPFVTATLKAKDGDDAQWWKETMPAAENIVWLPAEPKQLPAPLAK